MSKKHRPGDGQAMYQIHVAVDLNGDWIRGVPSVPEKHRAAVADALRSAIEEIEGTETNRGRKH